MPLKGTQLPEKIGPYRILERLGTGGMGEVFLAYDDRLDRRVAIKRIRPEGASRERRERFRREARMAAQLSHPAIVQVYDILQEDETDYIVMEHVEGTSLRDRVDRGPLEIRQVLELARDLADGLEAAHRRGIVHRDLKTENVLVPPSGRPKIADFGIAKRLLETDDEESLTADHAVLGTCRSMSPEQARGGPVDHRTDLFALGVLLYETITGRSPFAAENALATLQRILHHRQTPVKELAPAAPSELSHLVDQLLAKDPRLRPSSAGQVRKELDRLFQTLAASLSGTETIFDRPLSFASKPPSEPLPPDRTEPRFLNRRNAWLLAIVLLAALGVGAGLALRPPKPPLYVAVLAPKIGTGAGSGEIELLASGARVALLQGLTALEGVSPQALEEVDAVSGSPREIAKAVAADEVIGTRLDCRSEVCRVALTRLRGADGSVAWAESFEVPTDDPIVVANVMRQQVRRAYSGNDLRKGTSDPAVTREDWNELLRLRRRFEERREPSQESILAGLWSLRNRSPGFTEAYLLEARVLRRRYWASRDSKDFARALSLIQKARRLAPQDPRSLFELVDLAIEGGRQELAESGLEDLERLVPGDARLLELSARLADARGEGERALARMREAARLQPSGKRLHSLAQMEYVHGEMAAARETLKRLFERSPGNVDGLSLLASIELSNGDLGRAAELYGELVRVSPGPAELSNLALAYFFLGRYDKAAEIFRRVFETQPQNPFFALNLADTCLLLGRKAEADGLYHQIVERIETDPSSASPQHLTVKAQALAHLGQGRQAVAAVQEALRLAPNQGFVAFEASLVYTLLGEDDSALANAEKAIRLGVGKRWFSLPWFDSLRERPDFQELLEQARPGLG